MGASTLDLGILGRIDLFAYYGKLFITYSCKKIKSQRQKILLIACIFMSTSIGASVFLLHNLFNIGLFLHFREISGTYTCLHFNNY